MEEILRREVGGSVAVAIVTDRDDGDVNPERVEPETLRRRQIEVTGRSWVMLDEVHGTDVVDADELAGPSAAVAGTGDVLLADRSDEPLAVWAADCAPIALFGTNGTTRVVAHAGWRGLAAGILDVAVDALESTGAGVGAAALGPCIHPCCYEFGAHELRAVATGTGAAPTAIRATTSWGTSALDVPAAVTAALARRGVVLDVVGPCTGCDPRFHSYRRRDEPERHALVTWFEGDR